MDTININYPDIEQLYQQQVAQIWNELEVDLTRDRNEMLSLPRKTVDLMVKTIMWQHTADSIASRSIIETLGRYATNSELVNLMQVWSFFEVIHGRTYSHIIKQTFVEPNEALEGIYQDYRVLQRSQIIIDTFNDLAVYQGNDDAELKRLIIKVLFALYCFEAVAFMSSFAVTFGIAETGKFTGIGQLVKLICRDEVLHVRAGLTVMKHLKANHDWLSMFYQLQDELSDILHEVVKSELEWADYLFADGRGVHGLNAQLLRSYTLYMAGQAASAIGLTLDYKTPEANPLPYMDKYIDSRKVQAAAQEIQLTSYNIGVIIDDTADLILTD
jgi:ribonucleoside-diphosphate reductase beta chain